MAHHRCAMSHKIKRNVSLAVLHMREVDDAMDAGTMFSLSKAEFAGTFRHAVCDRLPHHKTARKHSWEAR